MKTIQLVIILILNSFLAFVVAAESPCETAMNFGEVCSLGKVFDPLCPCGLGIVLVDCKGQELKVSVGPSGEHPHTGFRVGSINPCGRNSIPVPVGGQLETKLSQVIWKYLTTKYPSIRVAPTSEVYSTLRNAPEKNNIRYLYRFIKSFERQAEARDWVNAHYSKEEQQRIFSTSYNDLESESEKEAYKKICYMYGNGLIQSARQVENYEFNIMGKREIWCSE